MTLTKGIDDHSPSSDAGAQSQISAAAIVRRMTSEDIDLVLEIEKQVFSDPWSRKSFEHEIANRHYSYPFVVEWRGQVIGYAVVWVLFEEAHIANLAIVPACHGKGWGAFILNHILHMGQGKECVLLEVRENNLRAIRLYERFGFEKVSLRKRYYGNRENAIVMKKMLS